MRSLCYVFALFYLPSLETLTVTVQAAFAQLLRHSRSHIFSPCPLFNLTFILVLILIHTLILNLIVSLIHSNPHPVLILISILIFALNLSLSLDSPLSTLHSLISYLFIIIILSCSYLFTTSSSPLRHRARRANSSRASYIRRCRRTRARTCWPTRRYSP
jgi:DNA integrity scanning protein DisA with diadenylate cyclase activity